MIFPFFQPLETTSQSFKLSISRQYSISRNDFEVEVMLLTSKPNWMRKRKTIDQGTFYSDEKDILTQIMRLKTQKALRMAITLLIMKSGHSGGKYDT